MHSVVVFGNCGSVADGNDEEDDEDDEPARISAELDAGASDVAMAP